MGEALPVYGVSSGGHVLLLPLVPSGGGVCVFCRYPPGGKVLCLSSVSSGGPALCLASVSSGGILSERAESMQRRAQGGHFRLCPPCGSPRTDQRGPSAPSGYPRMGALSKNTGDSCRVQTPRRELPHPKAATREQPTETRQTPCPRCPKSPENAATHRQRGAGAAGRIRRGKLPMRGFPKGANGPLWSAWKGVRGENPVERVFPSCPFFPHSFRQRKEWGPRRERH